MPVTTTRTPPEGCHDGADGAIPQWRLSLAARMGPASPWRSDNLLLTKMMTPPPTLLPSPGRPKRYATEPGGGGVGQKGVPGRLVPVDST